MYIFATALHIFVSLVLVLVIILQPGKGGDMGGAFGGGAATAIFGPQGPTNILQRATAVCAALFVVTSVTLAWYSNRETMANADVRGALQEQMEKRKEKDAKEAEEAKQALEAIEAAGANDEAPDEPVQIELTPDAAPEEGQPAEKPAEAPATP
ncbi:MAG TPA: preprotein translocase subunit SecG [Myxococcota bacterium]|nr:preprotein translocase subunit SecG [Myxococcota bacterium]